MSEPNLVNLFLGKFVTVDAEGYTVRGKLKRIEQSFKLNHLPQLLVLESEYGFILLRAWSVIKT